jgi:hypothetical protein
MVGKTSKKGWRNIKLTEELSALSENQHSEELAKKADSLFVEDSIGGSKGISKEIQREIKLLGKSTKQTVALSESDLLNRAVKKAGKPSPSRSKGSKSSVFDLWVNEPAEKRLKTLVPGTVIRRESLAPAVIPAHANLSVNPSKDDFASMIIAEAEKVTRKPEPTKQFQTATPNPEQTISEIVVSESAPELKETVRKTKAQKLKESLHKQMLKEHANRRKEKDARRALHDVAARKARHEELEKRRVVRTQTKVSRILSEAAGKFTLARGAGGRILKSQEIVPTEIAGSLRRIVPMGDPVLERRESLLRRRMIEQIPELNAEYKEKLRFAKLDSRKAKKMVDRDAMARCVLLG